MIMKDFIDDSNLTSSVKSMYKYINSHSSEVTQIMNRIEADLRMMFSDIDYNGDTITIYCKSDIDNVKKMVITSIATYTDEILKNCNNDIKNNIFKVYANDTEIQIKRRF